MVEPRGALYSEDEWITEAAEQEDGCDVSAGSIDFIIDSERVEE